MAPRFLFIQFAITALVLVAANGGVWWLAAKSVPRQLLRSAQRAEPATDLFLGNSTMAAGCDVAAFARARPGSRPINLGLGSSSTVEHYLIYRQQGKHVGAQVYYGFLDTQLTDRPEGDWNTLIGNRAMAFYVEPDVARRFYTADSPGRDLLFRICAQVPMFVERYAIWAKVERLRRWLGDRGLPARATTRFGRAEDFALLELRESDFTARCEQAVIDRRPLNEPVAALFKEANASGRTVWVIEMPMPSAHRNRFYLTPAWAAYRKHIETLIRDEQGEYINASDWVNDDGFEDALHLNERGAKQFSTRLGQQSSNR